MKTLTIMACQFKRNRTSPVEKGVAICRVISEPDVIIDSEGKPVKAPLWNFDIIPHRGTLIVEV